LQGIQDWPCLQVHRSWQAKTFKAVDELQNAGYFLKLLMNRLIPTYSHWICIFGMDSDSYSSRVPQFEMGYPQYSLVFLSWFSSCSEGFPCCPEKCKTSPQVSCISKRITSADVCTTFPPRNPTYFHMQWMDMYGYMG
jgi:hypothetical protein